jgi:HK97 family phage major capsid protein
MSIKKLREQRNTLAKEIRALLDNNPGKTWKPEHQAQYDAKLDDIERLDGEIDRQVKAADIDADKRFDDALEQVDKDASRKADPKAPKAIFNTYLRNGFDGVVHALGRDEAMKFMNTMSTTTGSEGGFTVPSLISSTLYDVMKAFGAMRATSEIIRTSRRQAAQSSPVRMARRKSASSSARTRPPRHSTRASRP